MLGTFLGAVLPLRFTGAVYLRRGVEHILDDRPPLPNAFYDEFVGEIIQRHEMIGLKGIHLKAAVTAQLEQDMIFIAAIVDGERSPLAPDDGLHMRMLRKHGVIA